MRELKIDFIFYLSFYTLFLFIYSPVFSTYTSFFIHLFFVISSFIFYSKAEGKNFIKSELRNMVAITFYFWNLGSPFSKFYF